MIHRILLITLTLIAPALHGMWCFDGPVRDAYDTYDLFIHGVQKNKKIVNTPTYKLLAAAQFSPKDITKHSSQSFSRWCSAQYLLARRTLQKTVAIFQLFGSKKRILQNLQHRITTLLPVFNADVEHKDPKMAAEMITKIILTESKHPGYQSFFHGANGRIAILFELQKKLYKEFCGKEPVDFEFLRARGGRKELTGITFDDYLRQRKRSIDDSRKPDRTNLLSVAYAPWNTPLSLFLNNYSAFALNLARFFKEILAEYNLPMPVDLFFRPYPSHGLFLHILMKNNVADRLVYNSEDRGKPRGFFSFAIPDAMSPARFDGQARIVLDPTVFDTPSDDIKIIRYQMLDDKEQKEIDTFCDNLIAQAEKLKAEQEKARK